MIVGYATPEETAAHADRNRPIDCAQLGNTLLTASQAGFGCYRTSVDVQTHRQSLRKALKGGVNLIDTSTNYADGDSEKLVGKVLQETTDAGEVSRRSVIVVSKVGYLQGKNFALSQKRKQEGRPFDQLVVHDHGLEHCIHPDFLADQLHRSLERLRLKTIDFYLLHNPEYYLEWAHDNGRASEEAHDEYYRRISKAFEYLEDQVDQGRIRFYGISSNTFPAPEGDPDFTCLETIWRIAQSVSSRHHLGLIQLPLNLLEPGAVLEKNQLNGQSVLQLAEMKNLGVLVNRPLNAFSGSKLIRLAEVESSKKQSPQDIIAAIRALTRSEKRLWAKILPGLALEPGLVARIKEQIAIGDNLKYYHLNFGTYENWGQARTGSFLPRVRGVFEFMRQHAGDSGETLEWIDSHRLCLERAFRAVGSIYAEAAAIRANRIKQVLGEADGGWAGKGTLSQKAVRAVRSTSGVSTVLVGMRRESYVDDVLGELSHNVPQARREVSWRKLGELLRSIQTN